MIAATCKDDERSAKMFDIASGRELFAFEGLSDTSLTIDISELTQTVTVGDLQGTFQILNYTQSKLQVHQTDLQQNFAEKSKTKKTSAPLTNLKRKLVIRDLFQKMVQHKSVNIKSEDQMNQDEDEVSEDEPEQIPEDEKPIVE